MKTRLWHPVVNGRHPLAYDVDVTTERFPNSSTNGERNVAVYIRCADTQGDAIGLTAHDLRRLLSFLEGGEIA